MMRFEIRIHRVKDGIEYKEVWLLSKEPTVKVTSFLAIETKVTQKLRIVLDFEMLE